MIITAIARIRKVGKQVDKLVVEAQEHANAVTPPEGIISGRWVHFEALRTARRKLEEVENALIETLRQTL